MPPPSRLRDLVTVGLLTWGLLAPGAIASPAPSSSRLPPGARAIVGGQNAVAGSWPWLVALVDAGKSAADTQFCGATLIAPSWVLTAAHCVIEDSWTAVVPLPAPSLEAVMGLYALSSEAGAERRAVDAVIVGPYVPQSGDQDIALLHLAAPSSFPVVPALVRPETEPALAAVGVLGTAKGWGTLSAWHDDYPDVLQEVQIPIADRDVCNGPTAFDGELTLNMLCAGWAQGGKDTCFGDSGGPFVVPDPVAGQALAGLVSWGYGCAQPGAYGAYTRVSRYVDWIAEQMTIHGDAPDPCGPLGAPGACQAEAPVEVADVVTPEDQPEIVPEIMPELVAEVPTEGEAGPPDVPGTETGLSPDADPRGDGGAEPTPDAEAAREVAGTEVAPDGVADAHETRASGDGGCAWPRGRGGAGAAGDLWTLLSLALAGLVLRRKTTRGSSPAAS